MKETGTAHWQSPNTGATNESGFIALPGGFRDFDGAYKYMSYYGDFWSSTENGGYAWPRLLCNSNSIIYRDSNRNKLSGFSVRCVKDVEEGTVTDIDGNVYQTVTIGTQVWMKENLKVTHYRNGDAIPNVTDDATWTGLTTGAYCEYNNDINNVAVYGRLYNWYSVADSRNIAPTGWHVPSDAEWKQLEMYLGMSQADADGESQRGTDEGGKLKEAGTTHWQSPNTGATNESGFSGLPGGSRYDNGYFNFRNDYAYFWSSTEVIGGFVWYRNLAWTDSEVHRSIFINKPYGYSVRCVKD
jgi:uncharacterized protein (TIGR02145 family)